MLWVSQRMINRMEGTSEKYPKKRGMPVEVLGPWSVYGVTGPGPLTLQG